MTTYRRAAILIAVDALSWFWAVIAAVLLRYDLSLSGVTPKSILGVGGVAAVLFVLSGFAFSIYSGRHRLGSYQELLTLGLAVWPPAMILFVWLAISVPRPVALSVPLIALPLALVSMLAARAVLRAFRDRRRQPAEDQAPAIVFGAGEAAEQLVRSMNRSAGSKYRAVAILDDDPHKARRRIDGVHVVGTRDDIARVAREYDVDRLVIAIPSAGAPLIRQLDQQASSAGLHTFVLPPVSELIGGNVTAGQLREVTEEDILGRRPIETDLSAIGGVLGGKVVLVTGAGGSIGSELCRQIAHFHPRRLVMLDRDESALHAVQLSISGKALLEGDDLELADIRDAERIQEVFESVKPDVVFHAAALKHLSLLEMYPHEAWKTNVVGTLNVLRAAQQSGVGIFINISTDKAANPICVLGYSKRITERLTSEIGRAVDGHVRKRAVRERARQPWVHARDVPGADRGGRAGHRDPQGREPLLHDDPGGGPVGAAVGEHRRGRRGPDPGHGRRGAHRRRRAAAHRAQRQACRHRVHGASVWGEAAGGAARGWGGGPPPEPPVDHAGCGAGR